MDPPGSAPVAHLTVSDLTLEETTGTAVQIESSAASLIQECNIRNVGHRGMKVVGGDSCKIVDCEIFHTGADKVVVPGGMHRPHGSVPVSSNHVVTNCHVDHTGIDEKHVPAIALAGVGKRAEHGSVHDTPRWGIYSRGNDHEIENTHVHHVCLETSDAGWG